MKRYAVLFAVAGLVASLGSPALADFYDDFEDGYYWYDTNYAFDSNIAMNYLGGMYPSPSYDPNDWDPNNPQWDFYTLIGNGFYAATENFGGHEWLRMVVQPTTFLYTYGWFGAMTTDGDDDPNTSTTYFDDSDSHYILARIANSGAQTDPNDDGGYVRLLSHANPVLWSTLWLTYEFYDDRPWNGAWFVVEFQYGTDQAIRLPNGIIVRPDEIDPYQYDPNDPNWADPNVYRSYPGYMDEVNGFWLLLQFEVYDANYPPGDPNGKAVWGTCWNGDKFDWDGTYRIGTDFPNYPNHPRARSQDIALWDNGAFYFSSGVNGLNIQIEESENPAGINGEAAFDEVVSRWGVFGATKHTLDLTINNETKGTVEVSPDNPDPNDPFDPNAYDPNDPNTNPENRLFRFIEGCEVSLVAVPGEGSFKEWRIYDPNFPGDANYRTTDTNSVLYLTMDADYEVQAQFNCGSGLPPFVAMTLLALGLGVVIRRMA